MADDYQSTLKGKIKILYQLEKWQDVVKLAEQYNEKYGKDVEIDVMRFKSERRLSKTSPAEENKARVTTSENQASKKSELLVISESKNGEAPPLLLTAAHEAMQNPTVLVMNEIPAADQPQPVKEKLDYEPFPYANELIITDPFAENEPGFSLAINEPPPVADELIITDPFAENEPGFSQAINEPPPAADELIITDPFAENEPGFSQAIIEPPPAADGVIVTGPIAENEPVFSLVNNEPPVLTIDGGQDENVPLQIEPRAEEIAIVEESSSEFAGTKIAFDFKSNPGAIFDTDPSLATEPQREAIAMQKNAEEKELPADALSAMVAEKPLFVSEPYDKYLKKTKSPRKVAYNFKYLLVLILPLAAAVILWLALSGKLNFVGPAAENVSQVSVIKPQLPAVQKPVRKVPPVVQIPKVDEIDKLVNDKILQANNFIKNNDILNALAVVLEAKKIKMTEPLRLLEEQITKKIRADESSAAEQKQAAQSIEQSEQQAFVKADAENTMPAWQNFILLYPQGVFNSRARNKIAALEKKAAQKVEQELQLKIKQAQKLELRSDYVELSQAELNTALQQLGKPIVQFELMERGNEKVIVDFSSGLMWTLWNKPMAFSKAKWWANRIYAGYSGWRLPTVEESLSLLQMDKSLYASLMDFVVWTGDGVSDKSRSIWVLRLPQGQFSPEDYDQVYYVWAVRKAVR